MSKFLFIVGQFLSNRVKLFFLFFYVVYFFMHFHLNFFYLDKMDLEVGALVCWCRFNFTKDYDSKTAHYVTSMATWASKFSLRAIY